MKLNYNELPDVNEYIKHNKLTPCEHEVLYGHSYNPIHDITYLVINKDNTYVSYCFECFATEVADKTNGLIVVCKGEIK